MLDLYLITTKIISNLLEHESRTEQESSYVVKSHVQIELWQTFLFNYLKRD